LGVDGRRGKEDGNDVVGSGLDFEDAAGDVDVDEEEYGEVIKAGESGLAELRLRTEGRVRGSSFATSASASSYSSLLSPAQEEFPFSIDEPPPPIEVLDDPLLLAVRHPGASDSVSGVSVGVEGSAGPLLLSWGSMAAASGDYGNGSITATPATSSHATLPGPAISSPPVYVLGLTPDEKELSSSPLPTTTTTTTTTTDQQTSLGTRRPHVPTDIDIRSISSHAQAEALVQRAQQDILEMEGPPAEEEVVEEDNNNNNNPLSSGRSPLSAKLAAYGESLALERRLKRVEEGMRGEDPQRGVEEDGVPGVSVSVSAVFTRDVGRKSGSPRVRDIRVLETPRSTTNSSRSRIRQPRRPNTSDSGALFFFFFSWLLFGSYLIFLF
jgi:hypothetical protein